jgi:hypothetical protein
MVPLNDWRGLLSATSVQNISITKNALNASLALFLLRAALCVEQGKKQLTVMRG